MTETTLRRSQLLVLAAGLIFTSFSAGCRNTVRRPYVEPTVDAGNDSSTEDAEVMVDFDVPAKRDGYVRVAHYNIKDVRTDDLTDGNNPRLQTIAAFLQRVQADILHINEIAYDPTDDARFAQFYGITGQPEGLNAERFRENYLAVPQEWDGVMQKPLSYQKAIMLPSNTGIAANQDGNTTYDFNNDSQYHFATVQAQRDADGNIVVDGGGQPVMPADSTTTWANPSSSNADGEPGSRTDDAYANDCFGYGNFPGQYAQALYISRDNAYTVNAAEIRTFQTFRWKDMPDNKGPTLHNDFTPTYPPYDWYSAEEWEVMRLSSKSHWDIPVNVAGWGTVHILASHPTPPGFDGAEGRNKRRNSDEIRFWKEYIDGASWIYDDRCTEFGMDSPACVKGGLPANASFVITGDLNDSPQGGSSIGQPMASYILSHERVNSEFIPVRRFDTTVSRSLEPEETFPGLGRVDYVLPSAELEVGNGAIEWPPQNLSDHAVVWIDIKKSN